MICFDKKEISQIKYIQKEMSDNGLPTYKGKQIIEVAVIEKHEEGYEKRSLFKDSSRISYYVDNASGYVIDEKVKTGDVVSGMKPSDFGKDYPALYSITYERSGSIISNVCEVNIETLTNKFKENQTYSITFKYTEDGWNLDLESYGIILDSSFSVQVGDKIIANCVYDNTDYVFVGWTKSREISGRVDIYTGFYKNSPEGDNFYKTFGNQKYNLLDPIISNNTSESLYAVWERKVNLKYTTIPKISNGMVTVEEKEIIDGKIYCCGNIIAPLVFLNKLDTTNFTTDPTTGAKDAVGFQFKHIGWSTDKYFVKNNKENTENALDESSYYYGESSTIPIILKDDMTLNAIYKKSISLTINYYPIIRGFYTDEEIEASTYKCTVHSFLECVRTNEDIVIGTVNSLASVLEGYWKDYLYLPTLALAPPEYIYRYKEEEDTKECKNWIFDKPTKNNNVEYIDFDKTFFYDNSENKVTISSSNVLYGKYIKPVTYTFYYDAIPQRGQSGEIIFTESISTNRLYTNEVYGNSAIGPKMAKVNLEEDTKVAGGIWTIKSWGNEIISYVPSRNDIIAYDDEILFATYKKENSLQYYDENDYEANSSNQKLVTTQKVITIDGAYYENNIVSIVLDSDLVSPFEDINWVLLGYTDVIDRNAYSEGHYYKLIENDENEWILNWNFIDEIDGVEYVVLPLSPLKPLYKNEVETCFTFNKQSAFVNATNYAYKESKWNYLYQYNQISDWVSYSLPSGYSFYGWCLDDGTYSTIIPANSPSKNEIFDGEYFVCVGYKSINIDRYVSSTKYTRATINLYINEYNDLLDDSKAYVIPSDGLVGWSTSTTGLTAIPNRTLYFNINSGSQKVYGLRNDNIAITVYYTANTYESDIRSQQGSTVGRLINLYSNTKQTVNMKVPSIESAGTIRYRGTKSITVGSNSFNFTTTENLVGFSYSPSGGDFDFYNKDSGAFMHGGDSGVPFPDGKTVLYDSGSTISGTDSINLYAAYAKRCSTYILGTDGLTCKGTISNSAGKQVPGWPMYNTSGWSNAPGEFPHIIIPQMICFTKVSSGNVRTYAYKDLNCPSISDLKALHGITINSGYSYSGSWKQYVFKADYSGYETSTRKSSTTTKPETATLGRCYRDSVIVMNLTGSSSGGGGTATPYTVDLSKVAKPTITHSLSTVSGTVTSDYINSQLYIRASSLNDADTWTVKYSGLDTKNCSKMRITFDKSGLGSNPYDQGADTTAYKCTLLGTSIGYSSQFSTVEGSASSSITFTIRVNPNISTDALFKITKIEFLK